MSPHYVPLFIKVVSFKKYFPSLLTEDLLNQ